jgi:amidophosphoribosyltransferase
MSNIKEECGVFGVWDGPESVNKTYLGLFSLQHRGQESAGIAATTGEEIKGFTGMGTVGRVFRPTRNVLPRLTQDCRGAIGHVRYSTAGSSSIHNAQPLIAEYSQGRIAIAHNGNLTNASLLRDEYEAYGSIFKSTNDTETIVHLLAKPTHVIKPDPIAHVLGHLEGAYCVVMLFTDRIEAARDPFGIRPLSIGKTKSGGYCVASESCAFEATDAEFVRDVEPGEIVTIDDTGLSSRRFAEKKKVLAQCIFENVYFARQNSRIFGENVYIARKKMGRRLAQEHPADADVVIPIPDSGTAAAIGFSHESGIPFEMGFVRSHYVGRSFIAPSDELRQQAIKLKLAIVREVVDGKRVVVVDDSIVRGNTTKGKIQSLRRSGAKEVHIRVSCPPVKFPCFYGVDFPTKDELIANMMNNEELREFLGADSLGYISLDGMVGCMNQPAETFCTACWDGNYKVPTYSEGGKFCMERYQRNLFEDLEIENE